MACVYRHIRLDNNKVFYIGIGKSTRRAYSKSYRNDRWHKVVNKYGYRVEIFMDGINWDSAKIWEMYLIWLNGRADLGYGNLVNMTDGGDGTCGWVRTEEWKRKVGESTRGRVHSEETKKKISEANKGKKRSEEFVKRMSEMFSGEGNYWYGKKRPDHAAKMSGVNSPLYGRKIESISRGKHYKARKVTDGVRIWDCLLDASEELNVNYGTLKSQIYGKVKNKYNLRYL